MKSNIIIQGDSLTILKQMPSESINCVVTSPPYWALRDYGVEGQLGLEKTFEEYIIKLCDIFDQVKRVLKKDGTCWVNLGNTYLSETNCDTTIPEVQRSWLSALLDGEGCFQIHKQINQREKVVCDLPEPKPMLGGCQAKSLALIPERFAIEMVNRGWILRNVIIWHKRNCIPASVKDRFTVDFEYVFFFVKSKKYWFETQYEPHLTKENRHDGITRNRMFNYDSKFNNNPEAYNSPRARIKREGYNAEEHFYNPLGRNKRTVWTINTKPFKEAHFAVFPEALVEPMIKAGCPKDGIVFDPFIGSGTTALVALKQNKRFIGIELNSEYIKIAQKRLAPFLRQVKLNE